jgi:hypothetical protein
VVEEAVEFGADLRRTRTRSYIEREVDDIPTRVLDTKDLVLPQQVVSRRAPLSTLPRISGDHNLNFCIGVPIRNVDSDVQLGQRRDLYVSSYSSQN